MGPNWWGRELDLLTFTCLSMRFSASFPSFHVLFARARTVWTVETNVLGYWCECIFGCGNSTGESGASIDQNSIGLLIKMSELVHYIIAYGFPQPRQEKFDELKKNNCMTSLSCLSSTIAGKLQQMKSMQDALSCDALYMEENSKSCPTFFKVRSPDNADSQVDTKRQISNWSATTRHSMIKVTSFDFSISTALSS